LKNLNLYLIEFAINSIFRQKAKNIFIFIILTTLIFLVTSFFQISNGLKIEALQTVEALPEITIQKLQGGRTTPIQSATIDEVLQINGVQSANGRVWGYYYFVNKEIYFTIVGIDQFEEQAKKTFEEVTLKYNFDEMKDGMIVGQGVKKILQENSFDEYFNFIKSNGEVKRVDILGTFQRETTLETNDVMLLPKSMAYEILELQSDMVTDIVVKVENIDEIETIASKIKMMLPDV
jgi:ABC-type lipoprotein release transport system permease subunit